MPVVEVVFNNADVAAVAAVAAGVVVVVVAVAGVVVNVVSVDVAAVKLIFSKDQGYHSHLWKTKCSSTHILSLCYL